MNEFEPIEKELNDLKERFLNIVETFESLSNSQTLHAQLLELQQELQNSISRANSTLERDSEISTQQWQELQQAIQNENKVQFKQLQDEIQNLRREQEILFSDFTHDLENKSSEIRRLENNFSSGFNEVLSLENLAWIKPEINSIRKLIYNNQRFVQSLETSIKRQRLFSTFFTLLSIISFSICIVLLFTSK